MADKEVNNIDDSEVDFEEMMRSLDALKAQAEENNSSDDNRDSLLTKSIEDFSDDDIDALLNLVESSAGAKIFDEDKPDAKVRGTDEAVDTSDAFEQLLEPTREPEPTLMPEPEPEPEPEPMPTLMTEPEREPEPELMLMTEPELESLLMPELEFAPELDSEPTPMHMPELESEHEEEYMSETETGEEPIAQKTKKPKKEKTPFNIIKKLKGWIPFKGSKKAKETEETAEDSKPSEADGLPKPSESDDALIQIMEGVESEDDEVLASLLSKATSVDSIDWSNNGDDFFKSHTVYDGPESLLKRDEQQEPTEDSEVKNYEGGTDEDKDKSDKVGFLHKFLAPLTEKLDKASQKTSVIPMPILLASVSVLFVIMIVLGILLVMQKAKIDDLKVAATPKYEVVEVPEVSAYSSNFIFVNQQKDFRDESLLLTKFSMDEMGTFFYFDKVIPVDELDIVLKDGKGNVYCMDTIFADNVKESDQTVIKFQPFNSAVRTIVLSIYDPETQNTTEYGIQMQSAEMSMPKRFITEPVLLQDSDESIGMEIEWGSFGTAGSQMQYKLSWQSTNSELTVVPINGNIENNFEIYSNGSKLFMTRMPTETYYPSERMLSGSIEFFPLRSLVSAGTLKLKIKNLYRSMNRVTMVNVPKLLLDDPESQQVINIATSKVVLERIGKFADVIALVYHAENFSITEPATESGKESGEESGKESVEGEEGEVPVEEDPLSNFTEAVLDCDLIITRDDGVEIIVPGDCRSKKEGGDVRFFLSGVEGMPDKLLPTQVAVRINSIMLKLPDVETSIAVGTLPTRPSKSEINKARESIETAFKNRLKLKEYATDVGALVRNKYFTEDVLNITQLAKNYTVEDITGEVSGNAYVMAITQSKSDENLFYATVEEIWVGETEDGEKHYHRTHEVTAKRSGSSYTIISDQIITTTKK